MKVTETTREADIKNAKLSTIKLHKCTIRDSEFRNLEAYDCTIRDSTFIKSKLIGCNIFKSTFNLCELYGVDLVQCDFKDVIIRTAPPHLSKLPVLVYSMIFKLVLDDFEPAVKCTNPLLAALRGSPVHYTVAVEIFNKVNVFKVDKSTVPRLVVGGNKSLSENVLRGIKRLSIDYSNATMADVDANFRGLSTITDIKLDISSFIRQGEFSARLEDNFGVGMEVKVALDTFRSLEKFIISTAGIPIINSVEFDFDPELYGTPEQPKWIDAIQLISSKLGIDVQAVNTLDATSRMVGDERPPPGIRDYGEVVWTWEANQSNTPLRWKE